MKFSVIMASTLAEYGGAASRRDEKIVRAIDSVIAQTFTDWELIVVADGCMKTMAIVARYDDPRIKAMKIDNAPGGMAHHETKALNLLRVNTSFTLTMMIIGVKVICRA